MTVVEKIESLKEQIAEISNEYCDGCQEYCCDQCTKHWREDNYTTAAPVFFMWLEGRWI